MGYAFYSFLILIDDGSDASLEKLKSELEEFYEKDDRPVEMSLTDNMLTLRINNWKLGVFYNNDTHVLEESKEMADEFAMNKPEKIRIATCKTRFEMSADPDPMMEYFNDSLHVQEKIESFTGVFVFDTNNSSFVNI